jgi:hypothetical protein
VPDKEAVVPSLATNGPASPAKIVNVELLGFKGKLQWTQDTAALSRTSFGKGTLTGCCDWS